MPATELNKIHEFLNARLPGQVIRYDNGFRRAGARPWAYPYVLVQVQPLDPTAVTYEEIERVLSRDLNVAIKEASGAFSDLARNVSLGSAALDRSRNRIVMRLQMDVAGVGTIQGLSVAHFGAKALVSLHCYAREEEYQQYLPVFTLMGDSFTFDPGYTFTPAPAGQAPSWMGGTIWVPLAVCAALAIPAFLVSLLFFVRSGRFSNARAGAGREGLRPNAGGLGRNNSEEEILDVQPVPEEGSESAGKRPSLPPSAVTVALVATSPAGGTNRVPPPFFSANAGPVSAFQSHRSYRVYVLPHELLFLDAGPAGRGGVGNIAVSPAVCGGLVGGLIAGHIESKNRDQARSRRLELDLADPQVLLRIAEDGATNFRAVPDDLSEVCLEAPSFWESLMSTGVGRLRFRHRERGKYSFEFQTLDDMKLAIDLLPPVLGDRLEINAVMDWGKWKYIRKS
jgi:hypothetical protein